MLWRCEGFILVFVIAFDCVVDCIVDCDVDCDVDCVVLVDFDGALVEGGMEEMEEETEGITGGV